ncbi:unknown [Firmicutes bacterium CAG:582]|nr:unknown [Firmicutes bacterium CAG:582]
MKNKKTLLFILLIILSCGTYSVKADRIERKSSATVKIRRELDHTGIFIGTSTTDEMPLNVFDVNFNGGTYFGYCLDYAYRASSTMSYTCNPDTSRAASALAYAYEHRTGDNLVDALTMRFIAIRLDKSQRYDGHGKSQNVLVWLTLRMNPDPALHAQWPPSTSLTGNETLLNQAYEKSTEAIDNTGDVNSLETPSNSLTLTNKRVNGKEVTYTVKASNPIDKSQLAFTCTGCNIKNNIQDTWNGTEGTLIVEDTENDCNFSINAYYPGSGAYTCTTSGSGTQQIEIFVGAGSTSGAINTSGAPTQKIDDSINEGPYYEGVCGPTGCGTIPADEVEVNNCCEDSTTSKVSEPILNDLFCRDDDLKVDYYKLKSGINEYLQTNTDLDSNYCQMYCTERTQVDIPGALTATNGKYFKLAQNSVSGTYAPHTQSTKRCRIRVEYDKWLTDYRRQVDASVDAYNEYQKNKAYEASYRKAASEETEENKKTETVTVRCVKEDSCSEYIPGTQVCKPGKTIRGYTASDSFDLHYYEHNFISHNYERIARNSSLSAENIRHVGNFSTNISKTYRILDYRSVQDAVGNFIRDHSDASCSVSSDMYNAAGNAENHGLYFDDVTADANNYKSAADGNNSAYTAALGQIETLQKTLTRCDKYFTDDSVSTTNSAEQMYNLPTSLSSFKYTQIYQDDYGNPKQTQVTVGFEGSCQYRRETDVSTPDTFAVSGTGGNYSTTYGAGFASMKVLGKNLYYSNTTSSSFFTNFVTDETYAADKMFWHDGRYIATCDWNRTDVDKYTVGTDGKVVTTNPSTDDSAYRLVPRGEVYNYKSSLVNYSEHEFVFSYSSSYDGKFETYWDLKGLGENSKFDKYFEDGAGTCANQNPGDTSLLTCSLSSFHGGSFYGCCCGDGNDTTYSTVTCDPYDDKAVKYEFKIVDPAKMFPADTDGYADNWKTTLGNTAREAIEELGKDLSTYSPKTLSYSFVLTPSDMKQIKKYNSILNSYGGYTDSDLTCDCSEVQGDGNKDNGKSCTKCTSSFLDNLASGKILKDQTLIGGWNRSDKSIAEVRKSGNVIWAVNK